MGREYDFTDIDLKQDDENKPNETNTQQNGVNGIKETRQESQNVTDTRQNPNIVSRVRNAMIKGLEDIFYTYVFTGSLLHPLYPMIQPNFYIEELIQNTTSRARMDLGKLTMF